MNNFIIIKEARGSYVIHYAAINKLSEINSVTVIDQIDYLCDEICMVMDDNFDEDADVLVGSMMSLLEPIMIIVLGLLVGTIVLAMFLPMIKMIEVLM